MGPTDNNKNDKVLVEGPLPYKRHRESGKTGGGRGGGASRGGFTLNSETMHK